MNVDPASLHSDRIARDFRARLLRFVRARVANPADAEDIVQEVLARLHRGLGQLGADHKLGAWLFQIARNAIVDHYRAVSRAPESVPLDPGDDAAALAENGFSERDATHCLAGFVEQLEARQAEALRLVDLHGLTHPAAAARLGLSVPGVKSRVQRARTALKTALERCCTLDFSHPQGLVEYAPRDAASSCPARCGTGRCGAWT